MLPPKFILAQLRGVPNIRENSIVSTGGNFLGKKATLVRPRNYVSGRGLASIQASRERTSRCESLGVVRESYVAAGQDDLHKGREIASRSKNTLCRCD